MLRSWMKSLFGSTLGQINNVRPKHVCLGVEVLESRVLLSGLPSPGWNASDSLAFTPASGALAIVGSAAVRVALEADGNLAVTVNGQVHSSDASVASFDPALGGAGAATLRHISLAGGGTLSLDHVTTAADLTVSADGAVTLAGNVRVGERLTIAAATLTVQGEVEAGALALTSAGLLDIQTGGSLVAQARGAGGSITARAGYFVNVGAVRADGLEGGNVAITTGNYLSAGTVSAVGASGAGGVIRIGFTASYIDTALALTTASANGGAGGQVTVDGGSGGRLFSSGRFVSTGTVGGSIDLFGRDIALVGASVDASGAAGGGSLRVGGDYHGQNAAVPKAQTALVTGTTTLRADAGTSGSGGRVIVWSEATTDFEGSISAQGAGTGAGGFIEVSAHGQLTYGGTAAAGAGGTLLLDPKELIVSAAPTGGFPRFNLINPAPTGSFFGSSVVPLGTGNIVVTGWLEGTIGATWLFNGTTGALLSALTAITRGSYFQVTPLTNGNFVAFSTEITLNGSATWGSGTTGVSGVVSSANSLIGTQEGDPNGFTRVTALKNGNYVVSNDGWHDLRGAVTWGNGTTGTMGVVSAANSLVGSDFNDRVGAGGVTPLTNGNYVVTSYSWNEDKGAVTWGNGTTGTSGVVSAANSLVGNVASGTVSGDSVGAGGVTPLTNGNYVVASWNWHEGRGAATWANGTTGIAGTISAANSLIGNDANDQVAVGGVVALTNGNYVVASPSCLGYIGAVTWGSGTAGVSGLVALANSLVGATDGRVGASPYGGGGVTPLPNGNYVVGSPEWNSGKGAATWLNGTASASGIVTAANSLTGSTAWIPGAADDISDRVGYSITALTNGNYVVGSPYWDGGKGAATWVNGTASGSGTVSAANSLVGAFMTDHVGFGGVTALANGNYVVSSPIWNNFGAVTWGSGAAGVTGTVSAVNSLVGTAPSDTKGHSGVTALANGNYVVSSTKWNGGTGAVTWGNGLTGTNGSISSANSLIGLNISYTGGIAGNGTGTFAVTPFPNGNYIVSGANGIANGWSFATWVNGTTGSTLDGQNTIEAQNSFLGIGGGIAIPPINSGSSFVFNADSIVQVGFTNPGLLTFALGQAETITVTPDFLTRTLNAGTNVTLQASNDITINSPITVTPTGTAGSLTLEAGRSILLNAGISTAGGNLTLVANQSQANGVVDGQRDADNAAITMAAGATLNTGAGTLAVDLKNSTDKTNNGSGVVTLLDITANAAALSAASILGIAINGTSPGDGVAAGSYTRVNLTGPINLNGAGLQVMHGATTAAGSAFIIVHSTGGVSGTFHGLTEGAEVAAPDGTRFTISYQSNGGKDVVLTQSTTGTVPPVPTASLSALRQQYGFYFGGSYFQNSSGMNEKWFLDATGTWYIISPDGTVSRWNSGLSFTKVASADPQVWNDPTLLLYADLSQFLASADVATLRQLRQQNGFYSGGSYFQNLSGMNEKWFQDRQGTWYIVTADGALSRWNGGTSFTLVEQVNPLVWREPALLLKAAPALSQATQTQLTALGLAHGFHFAGDYSLNWFNQGLNEKWFLDSTNTWCYITNQGVIYQGSTQVAQVDPQVWDNPNLLFQPALSPAAQTLLSTLQQQYGFLFTGGYYEGYHNLNVKWILDRTGQWYVISVDGTLKHWDSFANGLDTFTTIAVLDQRVFADPNLLFGA